MWHQDSACKIDSGLVKGPLVLFVSRVGVWRAGKMPRCMIEKETRDILDTA